MKILTLLNGGIDTASARERILRYIPGLEREGIRLDIHVAGQIGPGLGGKASYWIGLARKIWQSDGILIHRVHLHPKERKFLRMSGRPVIFDIDDAIWYSNAPGPDGTPLPSPEKEDLMESIKISRMIRTGNGELGKYLEDMNIPIQTAPTCVSITDTLRTHTSDTIRIGWTGNSSGFRHFQIASGAIRKLLQENPKVRFTVIAERPPKLDDLEVEFLPWSLEREPEYLDSFDIGIMPLVDDEWSRGKCGYKLLLYMSRGIPSIASPVGVNRQILENGKTGFLPATEEEWSHSLRTLVSDENLRQEMGSAAKASLVGQYDSETGLDALVRDLRAICKSGQK